MTSDKNQILEWNNHYKNLKNLMFWPSEALIRSLSFIKGKLNLKLKILDYGCGNGRNANYFKTDPEFIKKKFDYLGFDISKNAIRLAKLKISSNKFNFDTKIKKNKFNLVLCIAVLDQMLKFQRNAALNEIYCLIDNKGYLILDVLTKNKFIHLQGLGKKIETDTYILNNSYERGIYQYFFNSGDFKNLTKKFEIIYEEDYLIKNIVFKKLKKFYSRKILILKKNEKNRN
jgi:SAM-dependent methyltransferase